MHGCDGIAGVIKEALSTFGIQYRTPGAGPSCSFGFPDGFGYTAVFWTVPMISAPEVASPCGRIADFLFPAAGFRFSLRYDLQFLFFHSRLFVLSAAQSTIFLFLQ